MPSKEYQQMEIEIRKKYRERGRLETKIGRAWLRIEDIVYEQEKLCRDDDKYIEFENEKLEIKKNITLWDRTVKKYSNKNLTREYGLTYDRLNRIGKNQTWVDGDWYEGN